MSLGGFFLLWWKSGDAQSDGVLVDFGIIRVAGERIGETERRVDSSIFEAGRYAFFSELGFYLRGVSA